MKHKELTGRIIECAYQVYKKRLASFVYPVGPRGIAGTSRKIVLGRLRGSNPPLFSNRPLRSRRQVR